MALSKLGSAHDLAGTFLNPYTNIRMKTPTDIQRSRDGKSPGFTLAHASKRLIALGLTVLALPSLLSAQTLQHRYSFVSDASDSVGTANGTIVAPNGGSTVTIANGLQLPGGGGGGYSGYVTLPSGILAATTNLTIECWVTQNSANQWATIWDFANDTGHNFALCPYPNRNNFGMMVADDPSGTEYDTFCSLIFPSGSMQQIAYTYNNTAVTGTIFTNGVQVATLVYPGTNYCPGRIGGSTGTTVNALGNDIWNDPQFQGTIFELRIWNGVVSQRYLSASAVAGPTVLITNLTPTAVSLTAGSTLGAGETENATFTVELKQTGTTNILATEDATNWVSSNPSVLAVNSQGCLIGLGAGTATVSAQVAGQKATSGTITVTGAQVLAHRYSFVSDASDSVGGANGTIVPPGGAGTAVTINNGLVLPGGGGNNYSGYVTLPSEILTNCSSVSIECWLNQATANGWAEAIDFANNTSQTFGLITDPEDNGSHLEVAFTPHSDGQELDSAIAFPNGVTQHVVYSYNNFNLVGNLYTNGALVGTTTFPDPSYSPSEIGGNTNELGNDIYGDSQFQGTIYELRIWNGAVSPVYVAASALAGPNVIVTNLVPTSLSLTVTNTSLLGAATEQATLTGNLVQVSNVGLTGAATNWVSSNPTVLSVSSSGLITALNGGTATVSATVNGVTATSAIITVSSTFPNPVLKPGNLTLAVGDTATFATLAYGGSLTYQWSKDSTAITGATNNTLTLANLTLADAGTYSVQIANSLGTTNVSATLTVESAILLHRYSFASDASDSVGGANGTLVTGKDGSSATISAGLSLPGNTSGGYGQSGYLALPAGLLTNTTSLTIECWFSENSQNTWAEVWDFGSSTSQNFGLIPNPPSGANGGNMELAFTPNGGEEDLQTSFPFPTGTEEYVTLTYVNPTLQANLYTNSVQVANRTLGGATYRPGSFNAPGGTTENSLGNDVYGDDQFSGTIYEFRVWDGAVSPLYLAISAAAGPSVVVTNLVPTALTVSVSTPMTGGQTQQAVVTGNFVNASGITVTSSATNWISSNPSVLTVTSNGLVSAIGTGSATISATVNGFTGTSASVSVPNSAPIITAEPQSAETLLVGATLKTGVTCNGTPPFTFFWFTNSSKVPVSVSSSGALTVRDLQLAANGNTYTCVISNAYGTVTSSSLTLTVVAASAYQTALLQYQPMAYWPLDETTGTVAYDLAGGHDGTYNGGYSLGQTGPANTFFGTDSLGATFDGSSAYVDVPEGPFNLTNALTVVAWVNLTVSPGFDDVIGHGDKSWRISVNSSGDPGANDGNVPADATSSTSIFDGNWHQVVYTFSGFLGEAGNGSLYVDGAPVAHNEIDSAPPGDALDVWIGGAPDYSTARLLGATIADVSVFAYSLTANQVTNLFNGNYVAGPDLLTISSTTSGLQLDWQAGALMQAPTLAGPWTTNYAAVPPYTVPVGGSNQFFKLLINP